MQSGLILITWESGDFFFFLLMNNQLAGSARVLMAPGGVCVCHWALSCLARPSHSQQRCWGGGTDCVGKGLRCGCAGPLCLRGLLPVTPVDLPGLWDRAWPSVDYSDWICLCTLNEEQQSCKVDVKFSFPDHAIRQKTLWNVLSSYFPHSETSGTGSPKSLWVVNEASKETRARWLIGLQVVTFWRKWRGKFHFLHRLSQESTWVVSAVALHTACLMV